MLRVKTRLAPSTIHGIGLFANEFIPAGTIIWEWDSTFDLAFDIPDMRTLHVSAREQVEKYAFYDITLDKMVLCGDDARFFNHSDKANCLDNVLNARQTVALRDIAEGEELTADYRQWEMPVDKRSKS